MLLKPHVGWTDFSLPGTRFYGLSYLDDIAFNWLDAAVFGLEHLLPFCVKGFMEPGRFLCTVSYWNCHIITEEDGKDELTDEDITSELSHTSMLDFCRMLYDDISAYPDDWAGFVDYNGSSDKEKKKLLIKKLGTLKKLIEEKSVYFDERHCFL